MGLWKGYEYIKSLFFKLTMNIHIGLNGRRHDATNPKYCLLSPVYGVYSMCLFREFLKAFIYCIQPEIVHRISFIKQPLLSVLTLLG